MADGNMELMAFGAFLPILDDMLESKRRRYDHALLLTMLLPEEQPKVNSYWEEDVPDFTDEMFKRSLRVSRGVFDHVIEHIQVDITDEWVHGKQPIAAAKKLAMFLKFLGSKETVLNIGTLFGVTASSFIKARRQVCSAINTNLVHHISWPDVQELPFIANQFGAIGQDYFPGIVGALDGAYIPIWKPRKHVRNGDAFFNRKKFFSVTLQGVCREDLRFTDISIGCPSRCHDANVLRKSALSHTGYGLCQQGQYHVLADSAYPLQTWCLTPFRNNGNLTESQKAYNISLSSKRQCIERAFGAFKRRFPKMMHGIDIVDMDEINELILSACILHNICILYNDGVDDLQRARMRRPYQHLNNVNQAAGEAKRFRITNTHFI